MRTPLPFACVFLLCTPALAQIPNGNFESWSTAGDYNDPDGWATVNALTFSAGSVLSCEEGTPGVGGGSFARITTQDIPGVTVVPGVIFAGTNEHPGFPYAQRPPSLNGQWQFYMEGGDGGYITVTVSHWNPDIHAQEPVGVGYTFLSGVMPQWQPFTIPITYISDLIPDTAYIQIISSYGTATGGSTLWVDELEFGPAMEVAEQPAGPDLVVQSSVDFSAITITSHEVLADVAVYDACGRELVHQVPNATSTAVQLAPCPAGIYIARVRSMDGQYAQRRFVKER